MGSGQSAVSSAPVSAGSYKVEKLAPRRLTVDSKSKRSVQKESNAKILRNNEFSPVSESVYRSSTASTTALALQGEGRWFSIFGSKLQKLRLKMETTFPLLGRKGVRVSQGNISGVEKSLKNLPRGGHKPILRSSSQRPLEANDSEKAENISIDGREQRHLKHLKVPSGNEGETLHPRHLASFSSASGVGFGSGVSKSGRSSKVRSLEQSITSLVTNEWRHSGSVRVFLSRTVEDTTGDVSELISGAFDTLSKLCSSHARAFSVVDLRNGVGETPAADAVYTRMSFHEIERADLFLALLTYRYGKKISKRDDAGIGSSDVWAVIEERDPWISHHGVKHKSAIDLEVRKAMLQCREHLQGRLPHHRQVSNKSDVHTTYEMEQGRGAKLLYPFLFFRAPGYEFVDGEVASTLPTGLVVPQAMEEKAQRDVREMKEYALAEATGLHALSESVLFDSQTFDTDEVPHAWVDMYSSAAEVSIKFEQRAREVLRQRFEADHVLSSSSQVTLSWSEGGSLAPYCELRAKMRSCQFEHELELTKQRLASLDQVLGNESGKHNSTCLVIAGPAGSGKSALLRGMFDAALRRSSTSHKGFLTLYRELNEPKQLSHLLTELLDEVRIRAWFSTAARAKGSMTLSEDVIDKEVNILSLLRKSGTWREVANALLQVGDRSKAIIAVDGVEHISPEHRWRWLEADEYSDNIRTIVTVEVDGIAEIPHLTNTIIVPVTPDLSPEESVRRVREALEISGASVSQKREEAMEVIKASVAFRLKAPVAVLAQMMISSCSAGEGCSALQAVSPSRSMTEVIANFLLSHEGSLKKLALKYACGLFAYAKHGIREVDYVGLMHNNQQCTQLESYSVLRILECFLRESAKGELFVTLPLVRTALKAFSAADEPAILRNFFAYYRAHCDSSRTAEFFFINALALNEDISYDLLEGTRVRLALLGASLPQAAFFLLQGDVFTSAVHGDNAVQMLISRSLLHVLKAGGPKKLQAEFPHNAVDACLILSCLLSPPVADKAALKKAVAVVCKALRVSFPPTVDALDGMVVEDVEDEMEKLILLRFCRSIAEAMIRIGEKDDAILLLCSIEEALDPILVHLNTLSPDMKEEAVNVFNHDNLLMWQLMARGLYEVRNTHFCLEVCSKALAAINTSGPAWGKAWADMMEWWFLSMSGRCHLRDGVPLLAERELLALINRSPADHLISNHVSLIPILKIVGDARAQVEDYFMAVEYFERGLKIAKSMLPTRYDVHVGLARRLVHSMVSLREHNKASAYFEGMWEAVLTLLSNAPPSVEGVVGELRQVVYTSNRYWKMSFGGKTAVSQGMLQCCRKLKKTLATVARVIEGEAETSASKRSLSVALDVYKLLQGPIKLSEWKDGLVDGAKRIIQDTLSFWRAVDANEGRGATVSAGQRDVEAAQKEAADAVALKAMEEWTELGSEMERHLGPSITKYCDEASGFIETTMGLSLTGGGEMSNVAAEMEIDRLLQEDNPASKIDTTSTMINNIAKRRLSVEGCKVPRVSSMFNFSMRFTASNIPIEEVVGGKAGGGMSEDGLQSALLPSIAEALEFPRTPIAALSMEGFLRCDRVQESGGNGKKFRLLEVDLQEMLSEDQLAIEDLARVFVATSGNGEAFVHVHAQRQVQDEGGKKKLYILADELDSDLAFLDGQREGSPADGAVVKEFEQALKVTLDLELAVRQLAETCANEEFAKGGMFPFMHKAIVRGRRGQAKLDQLSMIVSYCRSISASEEVLKSECLPFDEKNDGPKFGEFSSQYFDKAGSFWIFSMFLRLIGTKVPQQQAQKEREKELLSRLLDRAPPHLVLDETQLLQEVMRNAMASTEAQVASLDETIEALRVLLRKC